MLSLNNSRSFNRGKKSKNVHLSPGQVHENFYLSCYQITCPCQGKDKQALNFLLVRRTLGENICLSCLKFNLSRAPGQVIFYPCFNIIKRWYWWSTVNFMNCKTKLQKHIMCFSFKEKFHSYHMHVCNFSMFKTRAHRQKSWENSQGFCNVIFYNIKES